MAFPNEMRPDMSVADLAFRILKNQGKSLHFKELIAEIMRVKAINPETSGRLIAQMHTEINLDSRFIHQGNGQWGLRERLPKGNKVVKIRPDSPSAASRARSLRDDVDDEDGYETDDAAEEEEEFEAEEDDYNEEEDEDD